MGMANSAAPHAISNGDAFPKILRVIVKSESRKLQIIVNPCQSASCHWALLPLPAPPQYRGSANPAAVIC